MALSSTQQTELPKAVGIDKVDYLHNEKIEAEITEEPQDPEAQRLERRLKWKLDLIILPLLSSVYFFASMVESSSYELCVSGF